VFEPFSSRTKPGGKGNGLGLSHIFGFAQAMVGDVAIEISTVGAGTTVSHYLPRSLVARPTGATKAAPVACTLELSSPLRPGTPLFRRR
jgi:hypothetical protein